jgi:hypothetical protein
MLKECNVSNMQTLLLTKQKEVRLPCSENILLYFPVHKIDIFLQNISPESPCVFYTKPDVDTTQNNNKYKLKYSSQINTILSLSTFMAGGEFPASVSPAPASRREANGFLDHAKRLYSSSPPFMQCQ